MAIYHFEIHQWRFADDHKRCEQQLWEKVADDLKNELTENQGFACNFIFNDLAMLVLEDRSDTCQDYGHVADDDEPGACVTDQKTLVVQ